MPRPFDFEMEPGRWFGSWFLRELQETIPFEQDPEWLERVRVPAARLQVDRRRDHRFEVHVPWLKAQTAFVAPGHNIYFGRRLLERLRYEDSIAFVIAHEIAHQDLGHLNFLKDWRQGFRQVPMGTWGMLILYHVVRRLYSPEEECNADRYAIDLCVRVGYDPDRCLEVFRVMSETSLNFGDLDMVFGPGEAGQSGRLAWGNRVKLWLWQRGRGYLPSRERVRVIREHLVTGAR